MSTNETELSAAGTFSFTGAHADPSIRFCVRDSGEQVEMMRIEPGAFYVRGVKVDQNESEARVVYDAFVYWLGRARQGL